MRPPCPTLVLASFVLGILTQLASGTLDYLPRLALEPGELDRFIADLLAAEDPAVYDAAGLRYQARVRDFHTIAHPVRFVQLHDVDVLKEPTFLSLIQLKDDFNPQIGRPEKVSAEKQARITTFLNAVSESKTWNVLVALLQRKNYPQATNDIEQVRNWLRGITETLWFQTFPRNAGTSAADTSAFEHVFMGEWGTNSKVLGLHNWLIFYHREQHNNEEVYYLGYRGMQNPAVATISYHWQARVKDAGSFFIGSSPEFDLAIYTICFLAGPGQTCSFNLAGVPVTVTTHTQQLKKSLKIVDFEGFQSAPIKSPTVIGSAYPTA